MYRALPLLLLLLGALWLAPRGDSAPAPVARNHFTNSIGMKLVRIPAGQFMMGSPPGETGRSDEEFEHEVEISRQFFMAIHLVTQGQYQKE